MQTRCGLRVAVVTMGQTPRPDVVPEILAPLGDVQHDEFGALDEVPDRIVEEMAPAADELAFFTRLRNDRHVIIKADFIRLRMESLVAAIDTRGYDLIVLAMTGIRARFSTRTPLVHGQYAVEAWIGAVATGSLRIGTIYPLTTQRSVLSESEREFGTLLQSSHVKIGGNHGTNLEDAIDRISDADLIVMNSVGYTAGMAQQAARTSGRPVVTASRIIGSAARLRLAEIAGRPPELPGRTYTGAELLRRLATSEPPLTRRETEVLVHALEGAPNKFIGRALGISHRTVEIHRSRALLKLGATSTTELIRRALTQPER